MIEKPLSYNYIFFLFMYILGAFCIIITTEKSYVPFYFKLFLELFFDIYIICCILTILPHHLRVFLSWAISTIFYLSATIDLFCFTQLGTPFSPGMLQLILNTTHQETSEFFSSYLTPAIFLSPIGGVLILFLIHIIANLYREKIIKKIKTNGNITKGTIIFIILIGLIAGFKNKAYVFRTWQFETIGEVEQYFSKVYYARRAQYLPIHRVLFAIHANHLSKKELKTLLKTMNNTSIDSCSFLSNTIVLIIGESYNKHHSQLYGYQYPTTPHQLNRKKNKELHVFTDAVTPYNITSEVFKNAFSLNDISKNESWCEKPLFTNIFKKAGYQVSFFSNEFVVYQQKDMADFSTGIFLNSQQLSEHQFDIRNNTTHKFDEELIDDYLNLCNNATTNPRLILFSLIGQHFEYSKRFPSKYAKFHSKNYQRRDLNEEQKQVVANYDNATLYNDYVVNKIIRIFEQDDAIIIYMPDHGEECFDKILASGRQHCDPVPKEVAINEYEIPFWIWCSKKYNDKHPNIVKQIRKSTNRHFYSDDLSHLLLFLGGISCQDYNDTYNILSPSYNNKRKRLLKNNTDYDKIIQ